MTSPAWAAAPARSNARVLDTIAFGLAVMMLLTYSEAWVTPLIGDRVDEQSSALVRDLYFPAYAAGLFLIALSPWESLVGLARQPFLAVILVIAGASTAWSVAPDQTLRREVALVVTTVSGVAIGVRWRWPTLLEIIATAFAVLAVVSLIAGAFLPSVGRMQEIFPGAWRGLWAEKNTFAGMMVFAFLTFAAAACFRPQRAWLWCGMAALAILLILLSTSKTSLVALLLGMGAFGFVLLARTGGAVSVIAVYFTVLGAAALGAAIALDPDDFLNLLGKDATLTGRTTIWAAVIQLIHERPLLGYGYAAAWSDDGPRGILNRIVKVVGYRPEHSHNGWLEQWLGMGLTGLVAWTLLWLSTLVQSVWSVFTRRGALFAFPFFAVYSLMTLTESIAVVYNDLRWVLFVMVATRLAVPERAPASHHVGIEPRAVEPQGQVAQGKRQAFGEAQRTKRRTPQAP